MGKPSSLSRQVLLLIFILGLLPGCQHYFSHKSQLKAGPPLPAPIPPEAPVVTVVGTLRLTNSWGNWNFSLLTSARDCLDWEVSGLLKVRRLPVNQVAAPPAAKKRADDEIQLVDFAASEGSVIPAPPDLSGGSITDPIEVWVRIDEFIAYRPMRLNATFTVNNARTGEEISTFQGTWHGHVADEHFGQMTPPKNFSLKRPSIRPFTEANALASLSPQRFLSFVAMEVTPGIHAACLSQGSVVIVSVQ